MTADERQKLRDAQALVTDFIAHRTSEMTPEQREIIAADMLDLAAAAEALGSFRVMAIAAGGERHTEAVASFEALYGRPHPWADGWPDS